MGVYLIDVHFGLLGYDAVHFGGDLGCEEDQNLWNGSSNLVIAGWSLSVGKWFLNLAAFKEHTKECTLEQGWQVGTTSTNADLLYLHCRSSINCPFDVKAHRQAGGGRRITSTNNTHTCLGKAAVSRARVVSLPFLLRHLPRLISLGILDRVATFVGILYMLGAVNYRQI
jgi:hypothetical protein